MPRRRFPFVQTLIAPLAVGFGLTTARLPLPLCRMIGRWLGRAAYFLVPKVRHVAYANLRAAYGSDLSAAERKRIAKHAAENMGIVAAEFSHIFSISPEFVSQHIIIRGKEHLDFSQGGLILGAHLGNWEWMAPVVQTFFPRTAEVVRPLDHPMLDRFVDRVRRSNGVVTIRKEGAGAEVVSLLRQGYLVGVLADQSPRQSAVPVKFFGKTCWATVAPILAALRAKVPVYVMSLTREPDGRYCMTISPPLDWNTPANLRTALPAFAQEVQNLLEALVRARPEQWLWAHRRWKTRPRLEEEWLARYGTIFPSTDPEG